MRNYLRQDIQHDNRAEEHIQSVIDRINGVKSVVNDDSAIKIMETIQDWLREYDQEEEDEL